MRIVATVMLVLGLGLEGYGHLPRVLPVANVTEQPSTISAKEKGAELARTGFVINVSQMLGKLEELRPDERGNQIADWAVYGTLMQSGLSSEALRAATYNNSPFRTPALEEVLDYAYGAGRRVFLADGAVWLFYSERDNDRSVTLARLADQVRMEQGTFPGTASVFRYRSDLTAGVIHVTREADVTSKQLFSSEFGYVERRVTTLDDLTGWLSSVDDVTHMAKLNRNVIELGGRRLAHARTEGVTIDDIAALYQAHTTLAKQKKELRERYGKPLLAEEVPPREPGFSLDPQWDVEGFSSDLQQLALNPTEFIRSALQIADDAPDLEDDSDAPHRLVSTARDVRWLFRSTNPKVYRIAPDIQQQFKLIRQSIHGKSGREVDRAAIVPFRELQVSLRRKASSDADMVQALLAHVESRNHFQCARYDGPLKGTRVGMILFYTDALAKLWALVDHHHEAPVRHVHGFLSGPIEGPFLEPLYWKENWEFPYTRLWFGTKAEAYKGVPEQSEGLNFGHIATRVYSAGSNPLNPSKEEPAAESSRRVLNWWDRHFVKVADYEQTYHILNEIMKWSVLTGWMAEHDLVPDLNKVDIYRSHRFDEWYAKSGQLRFREDIPFTLKERWPNGNECLEQIRSYGFPKAGHPVAYVEGGVSLGSAESLRSTSRIRDDVPAQLRQGSLDYKQSTAGKVTTLKNTQFAFPEADKTVARVVATISDKARIRNGPSELGIKTLTTQVGLEGNTRSVALISDQGSLGTLHSEVTADGVRLSWRSGVVANDEALVRTLAKSVDLGSSSARNDLLAMRNLYVVIREDQAPQIVRMGGGNGKGPIDPGSASGGLDGLGDNQPRLFGFASSRLDSQSNAYLRFSDSPNWQLRLGLDEPPKAEAAILEGQHATETINRTKWQVLLPLTDQNGEGLSELGRIFTDRGPNRDASFLKIATGDPVLSDVKGYIQNGMLYLERPTNAEVHPAFNDFVTIRHLDHRYLQSIKEAARKGRTAHEVRSPSEKVGIRAASFAREGKYGEAASALRAAAKDGNLRDAVAKYKQNLPQELLAEFANGPNSNLTDKLVRMTSIEKDPDWSLAQALQSLRADNPDATAETLQATAFKQGKLSHTALHLAGEAFKKHGATAATDFLHAKSGQIDGLSKSIAALITIGSVGYRLHTELPTSAFTKSRVYSHAEQPDLAARLSKGLPDEVYIEDKSLLNKHDWDAEPGPSLSNLVDDPDVVWEELGREGLGDFHPGIIRKENTHYTRREIPKDHKEQAVKLASTSLGILPAYGVLLARSCDLNNDSTVTEEERAACKRN